MRAVVLRLLKQGGLLMAAAILLSALVVAGCALSDGFGRGYSVLSRALSGFLGWVFSFVPFSAAECILYAYVSGGVILLIRAAALSLWRKNAWMLLRWFLHMIMTVVLAVCLMVNVWACNYILPKVDEKMDLDIRPRPVESLYGTLDRLTDELCRTYNDVPRYNRKTQTARSLPYDPDRADTVDAGGYWGMRGPAVDAMKSLQDSYPEIYGYALITPPKYITGSHALSYTFTAGIYIPMTGECNINTNVTDAYMPFTMCHEMAHRLGNAPEEDANFAAYLACMDSPDPVFRYSGTLMAFLYCYSQVEDSEQRRAYWNRLPDEVMADIQYNSRVWEPYRGPVQEAAGSVNDSYLTVMRQPEGIKSYGRMVDLLIAYHAAQFGEIGEF